MCKKRSSPVHGFYFFAVTPEGFFLFFSDDKAIVCQIDHRFEDDFHRQGSEFFMDCEYSGYRSGYAYCQAADGAFFRVEISRLIEEHIAVCFSRVFFPEVETAVFPEFGSVNHKPAATEVAGIGKSQSQRHMSPDHSIKGSAAHFHNLQTHL